MDYRNFLRYSKPNPRAESQRKYEDGWDRVFGKKSVESDLNRMHAMVSSVVKSTSPDPSASNPPWVDAAGNLLKEIDDE